MNNLKNTNGSVNVDKTEYAVAFILKETAAPIAALPDGKTLTVNYDTPIGVPAYMASGFLTGFQPGDPASYPGDALIDPLKLRSFRGSAWGGVFTKTNAAGVKQVDVDSGGMADILEYMKREYDYVAGKGGTYQLFFTDVYNDWAAAKQPYPGDPPDTNYTSLGNAPAKWTVEDYDWTDYRHFCTLLAGFVCDNHMDHFEYDLWNEADLHNWAVIDIFGTSFFWRRTRQQYYEMWKVGVSTIRQVHAEKGFSEPVIAGPSYGNEKIQVSEWYDFFEMCKSSNTLPQVITLHALDGDPVQLINDLCDKVLAPLGLNPDDFILYVNEYAALKSCNPGNIAWYLARCERAGARGSHAIWGRQYNNPPAKYRNLWHGKTGELCGVIRISPAGEFMPTGEWWVYERYAAITGQLYRVDETNLLDAVAGADADTGEARMLIGRACDSIHNGQMGIHIKGLDARPYLLNGGYARVIVERIPFDMDYDYNIGNPLVCGKVVNEPEVVLNELIKVTNGEIKLVIDWELMQDAYAITISGSADSNKKI